VDPRQLSKLEAPTKDCNLGWLFLPLCADLSYSKANSAEDRKGWPRILFLNGL